MNDRLRIGSIGIVLVWGLIAAACAKHEAADNDAGSGGRSGSSGSNPGSAGVGAAGGAGSVTSGRGGMAGSGAQVCPAATPATGEACVSGRGDCMYGTRICDCSNDTDVWLCWDPTTDCPTTQPAEQAACPMVGIECEYDPPPGSGQRGGDDCECSDTGWDCGGQFCPPAEPAAASACEGGDGVCMYGTRVCDCDQSAWACWNPSDCPATPPAEASACPLQGMACEYPGGECECDDAAWECDIDDADGGV